MDNAGRLRTNAFVIPPPKADATAPGSIHIKGVSWFGLESAVCYIGGSDVGFIGDYADFLVAHGFNAVRIPLAQAEVLRGEQGGGGRPGVDQPNAASCLRPNVYTTHNPTLHGLSYLDGLAHWIRMLGEKGLLVLLDAHVEAAGKSPRLTPCR